MKRLSVEGMKENEEINQIFNEENTFDNYFVEIFLTANEYPFSLPIRTKYFNIEKTNWSPWIGFN
jgi:hypothetical protein